MAFTVTRSKRIYRTMLAVATGLLCCTVGGAGAQTEYDRGDVVVDGHGILRWSNTNDEIQGFGVNYMAPFGLAFRTAKKNGVDLEMAIHDEVYHFARLGLNLCRIVIWDSQISDSVGNLRENEHLRLFDQMVSQMKERGINLVITPIGYWVDGYQELQKPTGGFSSKYGKDACFEDLAAIRAQENYLYQLLNHVNPYTGTAMKEEPAVIGFEICNEPQHRGSPAGVTAFINRMAAAIRSTGCRKPVFYNVTQNINLANACLDANIDGGTFQWYPLGLNQGQALRGNPLPGVDRYQIPFVESIRSKNVARLVCAFDDAGSDLACVYPAMARSLRSAGMQVATQFAYDPAFMANTNAELPAHYLNLAYTPRKAIGLAIAGEVFRKVPMSRDFGTYPTNTHFDAFRVSYNEDLAELISAEKFLYTNNTSDAPPAPEALHQVIGFGSSAIVKYEGMGTYFLDRIEEGVWRLEVMPDAIGVKDPYARNASAEDVTVINWRQWPMTISLPDLGTGFSVKGLNPGNEREFVAQGNRIDVTPGSYLLVRNGTTSELRGESKWKNIRLGEFAAPPSSLAVCQVIHQPFRELTSGDEVPIEAVVISREEPDLVQLNVFQGGFGPVPMPMARTSAYTYSAILPAGSVLIGSLRYNITVGIKGTSVTYPSKKSGPSADWNMTDLDTYTAPVVPSSSPVYLFRAVMDAEGMINEGGAYPRLVPSASPGKAEYQLNVTSLSQGNTTGRWAEQHTGYACQSFFGDRIAGRLGDLKKKDRLVLSGHTLDGHSFQVRVTLIEKDGSAFGGEVTLGPSPGDHVLPLDILKQVPAVLLPRPDNVFQPYYYSGEQRTFDIENAESLQIVIGPGIPLQNLDPSYGLAIESIRLE